MTDQAGIFSGAGGVRRTLMLGAGHGHVFRFEPNDLGKADFAREALAIEQDALVFTRHGRTIRFRRTAQQEP